MSRRTSRAISLVIVGLTLATVVASLPLAIVATRGSGVTDTVVVIPEGRRAAIERAIEEGGGCPDPAADPQLGDAAAVYCELQERIESGSLSGSPVGGIDVFWVVWIVVVLVWTTTGYLIVSRRGSNLAGWVFLVIALAMSLNFVSQALVYVGVASHPGSVPLLGLWATLGEYGFVVIALLPMLWLLFPDGQPPTPRWRVWVRVYIAAFTLTMIVALITPGPLNNFVELGIIYLNPIGVGGTVDVGGVLLGLGTLTVLAIAVASVFALRRRFKRATGLERQQLRWLRFVLTAAVVFLLLGFGGGLVIPSLVGEGSILDVWFVGLLGLLALTLALGIPAAYLVAIFRHGLWELDVVIRKTLIVAGVGITLTAIGFGLLVMIPVLFLGAGGTTSIGNDLLPVIIGLVLGLLFGPVRRRARRFADRVVYGRRATPYEVLSSFGDRLSETYAADDVLPRMAQVLAQATGAEHAVVWLRIGDVLRPEARWPADAPAIDPVAADTGDRLGFTEVRHQGELLGALSVEMPANDPLDPAREQLVADLAAQAGLVLRNVRLIEELRASRQRLVAAQDEERRKLERNIHDGVQQQLVALSVQLRLAEQLTDRDPGRAREVLAGLQQQTTETLEDLRDLARGIYPPLLADQGLAAALESQARKAAVPTSVTADGIGRYDRDVEATVYFCTLEAMNNVAKYAEASHAEIGLSQTDGTLEFLVRDDGRGFDVAAASTGTGLVGIADRLDALGGRLTIESEPGRGTSLRGSLPVPHTG